MINDLLDMAKIEARRMEVNPASLPIGDAIAEVERRMRPLALRKHIELTSSVPPDLPPVWADRPKVEQVLVNLVDNAIKFTPAGGWVRVEAWPAEGWMFVRVRDNGVGIRPADQTVIFEAFRQADSSSTREHRGTGLGLALCKSLVELQGGSIWVTSTPGQGSQFTFTLPLGLAHDQTGQGGQESGNGNDPGGGR